jgi:hypothetical protein
VQHCECSVPLRRLQRYWPPGSCCLLPFRRSRQRLPGSTGECYPNVSFIHLLWRRKLTWATWHRGQPRDLGSVRLDDVYSGSDDLTGNDGGGRGNVDGGNGVAVVLCVLQQRHGVVTDDDTGLACENCSPKSVMRFKLLRLNLPS